MSDETFDEVTIDLGSVRKLTLKTLQKSKVPVPIDDLVELVGVKVIGTTRDSVRNAISVLRIEGYDVKEINRGLTTMYAMVRKPRYSEDDLYHAHGSIKTPLLLTSDWHIGSKGFYKIAFNKLKQDVEEYGIEDVCVAGDVIQGRNVFPTELTELLVPDITSQITLASEYINQLEANVHIISGNHEEKVQGSVHVGLDALKLVANACPRATYYGHVAHMELNDTHRYMMIHGAGSVTASTTHMVEKLWRQLIVRPDILHMGHNHQIDYVRKTQQKIGLNSGTLQRTSSWLLQKGYNAKVGWWILEDMSEESTKLVDRHIKLN